jgi:hypothetical protein
MKKTFLLAALAAALASCNKDTAPPSFCAGEGSSHYIDASNPSVWYYFSFADGKFIGSDADDAGAAPAYNASWSGRTDWDFAVKNYHIRTNSGLSSSVGAYGGIYIGDIKNTMEDAIAYYSSVSQVPNDAIFAADTIVNPLVMSGGSPTIQARTNALAVIFQPNPSHPSGFTMPPVYMPAAFYILRSADGKDYYKVQFTTYTDCENNAGHVRFKCEKLLPPASAGGLVEVSKNTSSNTLWYYYSLRRAAFVDSAADDAGSPSTNRTMAARRDWDFAIKRYQIRTNSGLSTSIAAGGGVYAFAADAAVDAVFDGISAVPEQAIFAADTIITTSGMGGAVSSAILARSNVQVINVIPPAPGGTSMTYRPTPAYIFRTADGTEYYKVLFTNYLFPNQTGGNTHFKHARIASE